MSWLSKRVLGGVAGCAGGAALLAGYLVYQKEVGQISHLLGCGEADGCSSLLGGRWSTWMLWPISHWALLAYVALGTLAVWQWGRGATLWGTRLITAMVSLLALSAVWFGGLQLLVERQFCWYCTLLHGLGITAFVLVITGLRRGPAAQPLTYVLKPAGTLAGVGFLALIIGQLFGPLPATHEMQEVAELEPSAQTKDVGPKSLAETGTARGQRDTAAGTEQSTGTEPSKRVAADWRPKGAGAAEANAIAEDRSSESARLVPSGQEAADDSLATRAASSDRRVTFLGGHLTYQLDEVPLLGSPDAAHVLVKFFDYTCHNCREMHQDLHQLMEWYPDQFAVIVLPMPLNRACNPFMKPGARDHVHACEFARLSLAVWRTSPEQFAEFHALMFATQAALTPDEAQRLAYRIVEPAALQQALEDIWIADQLDANTRLYRALSRQNGRMPKLLLGGTQVMHGLMRDSHEFLQLMQRQFQLPEKNL